MRAETTQPKPANVTGGFPFSPDPTPDGEKFDAVLNRLTLQADLVATLSETPHHAHLSQRVAWCHTAFAHCVCKPCESHWAQPANSCGCRLCPHDDRRRSTRMVHRFSKFLAGRHGLRYLVLAERNSESLDAGMDSLFEAWQRLRKDPLWASLVEGAIVALEVTYSVECEHCGKSSGHCTKLLKNTKRLCCAKCNGCDAHFGLATWHPHLNILFAGNFLPFHELKAAWIRATLGKGQTAYIKAADSGTIPELLKYVTKLSSLLGRPLAVDEFLTATFRRRFVRTYGIFFRIPTDEDDKQLCCPDCGSTEVVKVGMLEPHRVSLDSTGTFRPHLRPLDRHLTAVALDPEWYAVVPGKQAGLKLRGG